MNDIGTILRIAARRLNLTSLLRYANAVLIALGALVVLVLVVERIGPEPFVPWVRVAPPLAVLAGLVTWRLWAGRRRSELQVAVAVDERLDLRERFSTALHCRGRTDPFAVAAIEDAVASARDPRVRERVKRGFSVTSPPRWWLTPLVAALAVGVWFVPAQDLFGRDEDDGPTVTDTVIAKNTAIEAVIDPIEESPELRDELSDVLGELSKDGTDPDALRTRQDVQRDAIKKLTDLNRRLDEILNGPKGKTAEAIDRALQQLKTPEDGAAKELADALAKGDFKAAAQALAELQAKAEGGALDEQQRKELAQQLDEIAKQIEQLAQQQQQLEELLQQAGLPGQLAGDPQALQQALQNNPNLNQQQIQQLQQMAQAQQAAQQMMQGLGQGLQQMAGQMQQGQMQQGQMGQQAADQLNQMEALQQMLRQAQAAADAAQQQCDGLGQGLGMQQAVQWWQQQQKPGGAFGQRGQGAGGKAPISPTPTGLKAVKSPTKMGQGDIIARQLVEGPQIVGESKAVMREVAGAVNRGFDEAQTDDRVPPKYREAHMHYFGELKKRVEAQRKETDKEEPPPEPKPADEADEKE